MTTSAPVAFVAVPSATGRTYAAVPVPPPSLAPLSAAETSALAAATAASSPYYGYGTGPWSTSGTVTYNVQPPPLQAVSQAQAQQYAVALQRGSVLAAATQTPLPPPAPTPSVIPVGPPLAPLPMPLTGIQSAAMGGVGFGAQRRSPLWYASPVVLPGVAATGALPTIGAQAGTPCKSCSNWWYGGCAAPGCGGGCSNCTRYDTVARTGFM